MSLVAFPKYCRECGCLVYGEQCVHERLDHSERMRSGSTMDIGTMLGLGEKGEVMIEPTDTAGTIIKLVAEHYRAADRITSPNVQFTALHNHMAALLQDEVEKRFGVTFHREEWDKIRTVGDLIALVAAKKAV